MGDPRTLTPPTTPVRARHDADDSPSLARRVRVGLSAPLRRLLPWVTERRTVVHGRASATASGEAVGLQRAMFGVRALGTVTVFVIAPLAGRIELGFLLLGVSVLTAVLVLQAAWFRAGRSEDARRVAVAGFVGDSIAGYLVVQAYIGSAEWVQFVAYPLLAIEAAVVLGTAGAALSTIASAVVFAVQIELRRGLGFPTELGTVGVVLGVFAIYGLFMSTYASVGRRMRGDLEALLAVSTLLSQQESPTRIVQALDTRLRELLGARVRSVAVRKADGTYEILRWRTPETRVIDLASIARLSRDVGRDIEADLRAGRSLTLAIKAGRDVGVIEAIGLPDWVRAITLVPIRTEGSLSGILPVLWDTEHIPSGAELDLLNGFAEQTGLAFGQAQLRRARELAATDSLTGLANHRAFRDALAARLSEARRHDGRLAILFCDLDRFKAVNDRHGHGVGDLLLHRIAGAIRSIARTEDVVARYGGDEIALLLPGADRDVAIEVGQRLREKVVSVEGGMDVDLTVGVAVFPDDADEPEALISRADSAMYAGKRLGGGCVVVASEMPLEA